MLQYTRNRLLQAVLLIIGISILIFLVVREVPGGPMSMYSRPGSRLSVAEFNQIQHQLGLDRPIHVQYGLWASRVVQGDFGWSYAASQQASEAIGKRLPATGLLVIAAVFVAFVLAVPVGLYAAAKKNSLFDHSMTGFAYVGYSIPVFWLGLLAQLYFSVHLGWLPAAGLSTAGAAQSVGDVARHAVLPVSVLAVALVASWSRFLRGSVIEELGQDYVKTALAKGMSRRRVLLSHVMRNSMIPMVTQVAIEIPLLFGGTVMTETVFSWPGMGLLLWQSLLNRDYAVLQGILIIIAALVIFFSFLADFTYTWLNPRIRLTPDGGR